MKIDLRNHIVQYDNADEQRASEMLRAQVQAATDEVLKMLRDSGGDKEVGVTEVFVRSIASIGGIKQTTLAGITAELVEPIDQIISEEYVPSDRNRECLLHHRKILQEFAEKIDAEFQSLISAFEYNQRQHACDALGISFKDHLGRAHAY